MEIRSCCIFGGINKTWCTMNYWNRVTAVRYKKQMINLSRTLKKKCPQHAKRHDKIIFQWQCSTACSKTGQGSVRTDEIWYPTAVFTRSCSIGRPISDRSISINAAWPFGAALYFLRGYQKLAWWMDRCKRTIFFNHGIHLLPEKWQNS